MLPRFELKHAAPGCGGYRGGGGDSSSSSTTQQTTQTTNIDKRQVVDTGSVGVTADSSQITVNSTDSGAVKDALTFAAQQNQGLSVAFDHLLAATLQLHSQELGMQTANSQTAASLSGTSTKAVSSGGTLQDLLKNKTVLYAGGAALAYFALKGKMK